MIDEYGYEIVVMNKPLIAQVAKFVITNEDRHAQGHYWHGPAMEMVGSAILDGAFTCESTGCVAGWGALIAGFHQVASGSIDPILGESWDASEYVVDETGRELTMHQAAKEAFGLSPRQADYLFDGSRTREELGWIFDAIEESSEPEHLDFGATVYAKYVKKGIRLY